MSVTISHWMKASQHRCSWLLACLCLLLVCGVSSAQESTPEIPVESHERVNVNQDDAGQIARVLDGIGPVRAEAIIRYREENGDFRSLEELWQVSGVGESTVMRNEERIVFE